MPANTVPSAGNEPPPPTGRFGSLETAEGDLYPLLPGSLARLGAAQVTARSVPLLSVVGKEVFWVGESKTKRILVHVRTKGRPAPGSAGEEEGRLHRAAASERRERCPHVRRHRARRRRAAREAAGPHRGKHRRPGAELRPRALVAAVLALAALGIVGVLLIRDDEQASAPKAVQPAPEPPPPPPPRDPRHLAVRVTEGETVVLRSRPRGRILARVGSRTEFGSPQTLAVAAERRDWVAVRSPALGNDQLGWVDASAAGFRFLRRPLLLDVDLSERTLSVLRDGEVARRASVAVGAPETPTPAGEFFVTDKLRGADYGPYYGCCILALSGRQPNLPRGWSGGDRLPFTARRRRPGATPSRTAVSTCRRRSSST